MLRALQIGLLAGLGAIAHAQSDAAFAVRLTPMPIDVEIRARVTGTGIGSAVLDGRRLTVRGSFSGLQGPATMASLHESPALGVRGPAIAGFDVEIARTVAGRFSADWQLQQAQLGALRDGRLYIQIHSQSAPEGNLWGWLLPAR